MIFVQLFDRFSFVIEWADVAQFDEFSIDGLVDPSEGQTLGSADIWSIRINPTSPLRIKERAPAGWMRRLGREELRMIFPDIFGLYVEDGQVIDTTLAASSSALEPCAMFLCKASGLRIDLIVQHSEVM